MKKIAIKTKGLSSNTSPKCPEAHLLIESVQPVPNEFFTPELLFESCRPKREGKIVKQINTKREKRFNSILNMQVISSKQNKSPVMPKNIKRINQPNIDLD